MYNTDLPTRADLPTSASLWRSTIIAGVSALALLTGVVLPSEYGIDPTGVGRILGLTEMGEIKTQLALEAAADREATRQAVEQTLANPGAPVPQAANAGIEARLAAIEQRLGEITAILSANTQRQTETLEVPETQEPAVTAASEAQPVAAWTDEISIELRPGEGIEFKLVMEEGAVAEFEWSANGAVLNYDTHGDGNGNSISYEKGRGVPEQAGVLKAAFTGNHGWFWRNRTEETVILTLKARGDYKELKRTA